MATVEATSVTGGDRLQFITSQVANRSSTYVLRGTPDNSSLTLGPNHDNQGAYIGFSVVTAAWKDTVFVTNTTFAK